MILNLLQGTAFSAVAAYLCWSRAGVRRRSMQSWESLCARLLPSWGARESIDQTRLEKGQKATLKENWKRILANQELWAVYHNARVMLELADFAVRNAASIDRKALETLRIDAILIRFYVLKAVTQNAFRNASASV